jgi:hypothetical protein
MRCANPSCGVEAKYFRSGSVHCIDCGEGARTNTWGERRRLIWLCPDCSLRWAVETWRPPGQQIRARADHPRSAETTLAASA